MVGGLWTGSLALLADSAHMAVDLASLGLSLFAAWAASLTPGGGPVARRIEVKAALANGVLLWLVVGVLLREALQRWREPRDILVGPMLAV
ncbi:MAG: cation efflux system protein, CDF family, partial [Elusimicrobia bacterium]